MSITVILENQKETTIGASYELISTTLGTLRKKILAVHSTKEFPNMELDIFNEESYLAKATASLKWKHPHLADAMNDQLIKKTVAITPEIQKIYEEFKPKYPIKEKVINYEFVLGSTFVDVEEDEQGNWYLLDGFRRTFVNKDFDDKQIFIRKFEKLSTAKWIAYMLMANDWKRTIDYSLLTSMKRGFMYAIYHRSGIALPLLSEYAQKAIDHLLTVGVAYNNEWFLNTTVSEYGGWTLKDIYALYFDDNDEFFNDLLFIQHLDSIVPPGAELKLYTGKAKKEVREYVPFHSGDKSDVFNMIVGCLAEVRKFEAIKGQDRYELNPETYKPVLEALFDDAAFVKSIWKLNELYSLDAHRKNTDKLAKFVRDYILTNLFEADPMQIQEEVPMVKYYMEK